MKKIAFFTCLLGLLAATPPATARPAARASWPFWLSSPERHGQRKMPGDYTHHYGTYRNHSRQESSGLFGFLRGNGHAPARHRGSLHARKSGHRRTSGLF